MTLALSIKQIRNRSQFKKPTPDPTLLKSLIGRERFAGRQVYQDLLFQEPAQLMRFGRPRYGVPRQPPDIKQSMIVTGLSNRECRMVGKIRHKTDNARLSRRQA